eukprot:CAMPEP_0175169724 /NCGR_PEP_ID=MMETSP0087-20121206/29769_1 /TAXON_ID=136419 /ORGANISM="Unknown Unknown, Strain D1" /LENGTH=1007 /DNA_ID=CAMNT_0016460181 /DNA_START=61 /DNA_END=3084 /DNA_ORIENTATION=-
MRVLTALAVAAAATQALHYTELPHGQGLRNMDAIAESIAESRAASKSGTSVHSKIDRLMTRDMDQLHKVEKQIDVDLEKKQLDREVKDDIGKVAKVISTEAVVHGHVKTAHAQLHVKTAHIQAAAAAKPSAHAVAKAGKAAAAAHSKTKHAKETLEQAQKELSQALKAQKKLDPHQFPKMHTPAKIEAHKPSAPVAEILHSDVAVHEHKPKPPAKQAKQAAKLHKKQTLKPGVTTRLAQSNIDTIPGHVVSKWQNFFGGFTSVRVGDTSAYSKQLLTSTIPVIVPLLVAAFWTLSYFTCCCCRSPCPNMCRSRRKTLTPTSFVMPLYVSLALAAGLVAVSVWAFAVNARLSQTMDKDNTLAGFASNGFRHSKTPSSAATTFFETDAFETEAEVAAEVEAGLDPDFDEVAFAQTTSVTECDAGHMGEVFGTKAESISKCSAMIRSVLTGGKHYVALECPCLVHVSHQEARQFKCKFPATANHTIYDQWKVCNPGAFSGQPEKADVKSTHKTKLNKHSASPDHKQSAHETATHKTATHKTAAHKTVAHKAAAAAAHKTAVHKTAAHKAAAHKTAAHAKKEPVKKSHKATVEEEQDVWGSLKYLLKSADNVLARMHKSVQEMSSETSAMLAAAALGEQEHKINKVDAEASKVMQTLDNLASKLPKGGLQKQLFAASKGIASAKKGVLAPQEKALHSLSHGVAKVAERHRSAMKHEAKTVESQLSVAQKEMAELQDTLVASHAAALNGEIVREVATIFVLLCPALLFPFLLMGLVRKSHCNLKFASVLTFISLLLCWITCAAYYSASVVNADICQELDTMEVHPELYMPAQQAKLVDACLHKQPLNKAFSINKKLAPSKFTWPSALDKHVTLDLSHISTLTKKAEAAPKAAKQAKASAVGVEHFEKMLDELQKSFGHAVSHTLKPLALASNELQDANCGQVPPAYFEVKKVVCGQVLSHSGALALAFGISGFALFFLALLVPLATTRLAIISDKYAFYTHDVEPFSEPVLP